MNALHTMLDDYFRYYCIITKLKEYGKKKTIRRILWDIRSLK